MADSSFFFKYIILGGGVAAVSSPPNSFVFVRNLLLPIPHTSLQVFSPHAFFGSVFHTYTHTHTHTHSARKKGTSYVE
jgi:hypothetical protein